MTKEQELMAYLHEKVFDPIMNSSDIPADIKRGVSITVVRMERLSAEKMVQYFWSALTTDNAIGFSKKLKTNNLPRFEDIMEEFRDKFNDKWLKS